MPTPVITYYRDHRAGYVDHVKIHPRMGKAMTYYKQHAQDYFYVPVTVERITHPRNHEYLIVTPDGLSEYILRRLRPHEVEIYKRFDEDCLFDYYSDSLVPPLELE